MTGLRDGLQRRGLCSSPQLVHAQDLAISTGANAGAGVLCASSAAREFSFARSRSLETSRTTTLRRSSGESIELKRTLVYAELPTIHGPEPYCAMLKPQVAGSPMVHCIPNRHCIAATEANASMSSTQLYSLRTRYDFQLSTSRLLINTTRLPQALP
ncbi:hypothetical protein PENSPDRAFT_81992 [Peniophora sp. CONT]|nr:hypothetical protein PENSPDRAFT_81992 [Peniophora sp. CONT]